MSYKDNNWKLRESRQPIATKINAVMEKYSFIRPFQKSAVDIEEDIFNKSKSQDEYSNEVEKILQRIESILASKESPSTETMPSTSKSIPSFLTRALSKKSKKSCAATSQPCNIDTKIIKSPTPRNRSSPSSSAPSTPSPSESVQAEENIQTLSETVEDAEPAENLSTVAAKVVELESEDDGFVLLPNKRFKTFENIFAREKESDATSNRMTQSCFNFEEKSATPSPELKDDLKVYVEFLEHKLRKVTDPRKLCILKHKIDQILFENEVDQCQTEKSEAERLKIEETWKTKDFRKIVADKIEEVKDKYDICCIKSSIELEQDEFIKSKTQDEYISYVTALMLRLLDSNSSNRCIAKQSDAIRAVSMVVTELTKLSLKKPVDDN